MCIPPPPHTHSRISNPLKRYSGMLDRGCRENSFSWETESIEMIPKPTMKRCEISTSRKGCEIAFLSRYRLKISIWNSLWISLLVIGDHKVYNNLRGGIVILIKLFDQKREIIYFKRVSESVQN